MIRPSAAIVYLDEHREPRRGVVRLAGRVRTLLVEYVGRVCEQRSAVAHCCCMLSNHVSGTNKCGMWHVTHRRIKTCHKKMWWVCTHVYPGVMSWPGVVCFTAMMHLGSDRYCTIIHHPYHRSCTWQHRHTRHKVHIISEAQGSHNRSMFGLQWCSAVRVCGWERRSGKQGSPPREQQVYNIKQYYYYQITDHTVRMVRITTQSVRSAKTRKNSSVVCCWRLKKQRSLFCVPDAWTLELYFAHMHKLRLSFYKCLKGNAPLSRQ